MKFGKVDYPEHIDFKLPTDHLDTKRVLGTNPITSPLIHVGCPSWNKASLKGFYPRGTKDELEYYARRFNAVELNATFYRIFPPEQFAKWYDKTSHDFKFYPKLNQEISHWKRLNDDVAPVVDNFLYSAINLKEKLGCIFLQMPENFAPKDFGKVENFIECWPKEVPLAIEFRHTEWFNDQEVAEDLYTLLEANAISNVIVDSPGRRDLLHMRLTNSRVFVRYVATNHRSDYQRLDQWVDRLKLWKEYGINHINFFIHQDIDKESSWLSDYFIEHLNSKLGANLVLPNTERQQKLF